jgi:hypothetical protein
MSAAARAKDTLSSFSLFKADDSSKCVARYRHVDRRLLQTDCQSSGVAPGSRTPKIRLQSGRIGSERRRPGCIPQGIGSRDCGADGKGVESTGAALVCRPVSSQVYSLSLPDAASCSMLRRQLLQLARRLCQDTNFQQHSPPFTHSQLGRCQPPSGCMRRCVGVRGSIFIPQNTPAPQVQRRSRCSTATHSIASCRLRVGFVCSRQR